MYVLAQLLQTISKTFIFGVQVLNLPKFHSAISRSVGHWCILPVGWLFHTHNPSL